MNWRRHFNKFKTNRARRDPEIAPDEIFLDASNASDFDQARFEGRIEQPLSRSVFGSILGIITILFLILIARAGDLEVLRGAAFAAESAHNSLESRILFAPRGIITDLRGTVLAENVEKPDGLPGQGSALRAYPMPVLGQVLGYVSYPKKDANGVYYDTTEKGLAGLEQEYDNLLAGVNGQVLTETDALGRVRSEGMLVPAKDGGALVLSLDADLEQRFARAIRDVAINQHFIAGTGVILDVHTGAVRAIVSYPAYDPNVLAKGGPASVISAYANDPGRPFLDHAVRGVYTPGSIVKPFIAAGALTDGLITPNTSINDSGFLSLPDPYHPGKTFIYKGWKALGKVDVRKAIAWSSDVFFYTIGGGFGSQKGLGIDRLDYWYRAFGLGSPTGIDLPGEASGLIPTPAWKQTAFHEPWYLGDTYFTAIGQYSMQVTPIQMARATAAIANGGRLYTPTLRAGETLNYHAVPVDAVALQVVREGMRAGVTSALASAINLPYMSVAAKTGTAQTGAKNQYDNAWVEGFFPYEHPEYAFAVVLERGPSGAGEQAVNVMRELFDSLHAANSPYIGGTGAATSTLAS